MAAIWSALAIGFLGSFHCIGMCGPIALSLPYQGRKPLASAANVLLYNLGRAITYGLLGAVIGLVGKGFFLAGAQSYLSMGLGLLLLTVALFSIDMESQLLRVPIISRLNQWVTRQLGRIIGQGGPLRLLGIGVLNGLLPCGLVYVAIVGAIGTGTALQGALYMAAFGLGTLPLMMATALAGQFVPLSWRRSVRKLLPVFLAGFALLFIMRGLNFDVPIDLRFWDNMQDAPMCH